MRHIVECLPANESMARYGMGKEQQLSTGHVYAVRLWPEAGMDCVQPPAHHRPARESGKSAEHRVAFVGKCSKCVAAAAERFGNAALVRASMGTEARKVASGITLFLYVSHGMGHFPSHAEGRLIRFSRIPGRSGRTRSCPASPSGLCDFGRTRFRGGILLVSESARWRDTGR